MTASRIILIPKVASVGGGAVTASDVAFTPTGSIAATNVQTAIAEVATDAAAAYATSGAVASAVSAHEADTTNVHGIADTSVLLTTTAAPELIRDTIGTALTAGAGITITPNDGADTITVASSITQYTDEMARDALGTALVAGSNITITPNDGADTITIAASGGDITTASVWAARGDLLVATGNDAAAVLTVGANGTQPIADSNQASGLKYVGSPMTRAPRTTSQAGYYMPDTFATINNPTNQGSATPQEAYWFPFWLPRRCSPTFTIYVFTNEAGATGRMSIWSNDEATFRPATGGLIEDLGSLSAATGGSKQATPSSPIGPGWIWVGTWVSNHTTVRWGRYGSGLVNQRLMGDHNLLSSRPVFGWMASSLDYSSAWNSTLPSLTAANAFSNSNATTPYMENV